MANRSPTTPDFDPDDDLPPPPDFDNPPMSADPAAVATRFADFLIRAEVIFIVGFWNAAPSARPCYLHNGRPVTEPELEAACRHLCYEVYALAQYLADVHVDGRACRDFGESLNGGRPRHWPRARTAFAAARADLREGQGRWAAKARRAAAVTGDPQALAGGAPTAAPLVGEARALALLVQNPGWTDTQVAKAVPCSRQTLYTWTRYTAAHKAAKEAGKKQMPRGSKTAGGDLESWEDRADR